MAKTPVTPLDRLRKKKPITSRLVIPIEDGLTQSVDDARDELARALLLSDADREKVARASLAVAIAKLEEQSIIFTFAGVGRVAFEEILRDNEPTAAQKAKAEENGENISWNPDTFPAEIISACLTEPRLTPREVKDEILDSELWGANEVRLILDTAVEVNTRRRVANLGN